MITAGPAGILGSFSPVSLLRPPVVAQRRRLGIHVDLPPVYIPVYRLFKPHDPLFLFPIGDLLLAVAGENLYSRLHYKKPAVQD